jgi:iron(III) transport system ATP-binding protein
MRAGRVVQEGTAHDLYDRPRNLFVARFFSHLNELEGTVLSGLAVTRIGSFATKGGRDGDAVVVAIRPPGVRLSPGAAGTSGLPGRIVSRHFLGEIDHFDVAVDGFESYLVAKAAAVPNWASARRCGLPSIPATYLSSRKGSDRRDC